MSRIRRGLEYVLFTLSILGLLACGASEVDYGVYCIISQEDGLIAFVGINQQAEYGWYKSVDGGSSWVGYQPDNTKAWPSCQRETPPWLISDHLHENILWRITGSIDSIERSDDAGETWYKVYKFPPGEQVREYFYRPYPQNFGPHSRVIRPGGPYNGVVDHSTGNLVVSMGFEGVIVAAEDGEIKRVAVGEYSFVDIHQLSIRQRLHNELFLTLWLACLVIAVLSIPLCTRSSFRSIFISATIIAVVIWLLFCVFSKEVGNFYYLQQILVFVKAWLIYPLLAIAGSIRIFQERVWKLSGFVAINTAVAAMLFLLPLFLWANGWVPVYQIAIIVGLLLILLQMWIAYRWVSERRYG